MIHHSIGRGVCDPHGKRVVYGYELRVCHLIIAQASHWRSSSARSYQPSKEQSRIFAKQTPESNLEKRRFDPEVGDQQKVWQGWTVGLPPKLKCDGLTVIRGDHRQTVTFSILKAVRPTVLASLRSVVY